MMLYFGGDYYSGGTVTSLYNTQIHWERSESWILVLFMHCSIIAFLYEFDYYRRVQKKCLDKCG